MQDKKGTDRYQLVMGDCLEVMRGMGTASIDAVVTDPPYGLSQHSIEDVHKCLAAWLRGKSYVPKGTGFMSQKWDAWVPGPEVWRECFRVIKPGGYILVFAGTRSFDLMSIAIRLAGFQIKDTIMYCFGSGFPHGLNISKGIDKHFGIEREVIGTVKHTHFSGSDIGSNEGYSRPSHRNEDGTVKRTMDITAPATELGKRYEGYNTYLKPAYEPILLCQKPVEGTIVENVIKYGTGGMNIDGCRVSTDQHSRLVKTGRSSKKNCYGEYAPWDGEYKEETRGRYPGNLVHDGSEEVVSCFPETGASTSRRTFGKGRGDGNSKQNTYGDMYRTEPWEGVSDSGGSAARFFNCCLDDDSEDGDIRRLLYFAKASRGDRNEGLSKLKLQKPTFGDDGGTYQGLSNSKYPVHNNHPTVKSTSLMRHLVRLVTPVNGTVLDPFMGSGSTGKGALLEGFNFIGIDTNEDYVKIAEARCVFAMKQVKQKTLF